MPRDLALLPKAHLHLHLDGSLRPSTVAELAAGAGIAAPMPTGYGSFAAFSATISAAAACMRTADDVVRVLDEIVEDARAAGAVWVEVSMWPGLFAGRLGSDSDTVRTVLDGLQRAGIAHRVGVGLVLAANRGHGPAQALDVARLASGFAGDGVVGFGLDGDESSYPPALFADACARARAAGLPVVPHAGELLGAGSVADAVDLLGARRVMHGVRCTEDPRLVARLADSGIVLDVSVVPSLREHPLPALLAAGVRCTVNADDPLLFGTDLLTEYQRCREQLGLTDAQLADVARTSLEASAAPVGVVAAALARIDAWLGLSGPLGPASAPRGGGSGSPGPADGRGPRPPAA